MKRYLILLIIRDFELELQINMIYIYGIDKFRTSDDLPSPWVWGETTSNIDWQEQYLHMYALVEIQGDNFFFQIHWNYKYTYPWVQQIYFWYFFQ